MIFTVSVHARLEEDEDSHRPCHTWEGTSHDLLAGEQETGSATKVETIVYQSSGAIGLKAWGTSGPLPPPIHSNNLL
jgi:hypothetical protein